MGDLTRSQYVMRRQALEDEVQRIGPPIDPDIARAEALLDDFARFWEIEHNPAERQKLLTRLFDRVWQDGGAIVDAKPRARSHATSRQRTRRGATSGSDGTRTRDLWRDRP
jgi:hypothetical protein